MRLDLKSPFWAAAFFCWLTPYAVLAADEVGQNSADQSPVKSNAAQADGDAGEPAAPEGLLPKQLSNPFFRRLVYHAYFWRLRYYFVAQNAANCDLFYGQIQDDPFIGRAAVDFVFPNGCQCHGYALVTHYPHPRSVVGQSGFIKTKCSDGRRIEGRFTTTSLTTGHGTASDNLGNNYEFTFGQQAEQAVQEVNQLRKRLGCQECTPQEVELKVTGKILPPKQK